MGQHARPCWQEQGAEILKERPKGEADKRGEHLKDGVTDDVHSLCICHSITDADGEAVLQQPVVHGVLRLGQERPCSLRPLLHPDDMD